MKRSLFGRSHENDTNDTTNQIHNGVAVAAGGGPVTLHEWAIRHGVSQAALRELIDEALPGELPGDSEAAVQTRVRIEASNRGWRLWRNNVGAVTTDDGRHVRFGLCNESAGQNARLKSSDLVGIRPVRVTEAMVGDTIGQFAAVEVKRKYWRPTGSARETAQGAFLGLVRSLGGYGTFSTGGLGES